MVRVLTALVALLFAASAQAQESAPPQLDPALLARAEAGDVIAAASVSEAFLRAEDYETSARWARIGAEGGGADAMNAYAVSLRLTNRPDALADAEVWELRAIEAGSDAARINRASRVHLFGDGDWDAMMALLRDVHTEQGATMLLQVALGYASTPGAQPARSRALMQLAAERGEHQAQWRYAMMLNQGVAGPRDSEGAYEWTRRSAEGGYVRAMISTAVMLATAEGVAENDVEARAWYVRASESGQAGAAHALRGLGGMLLVGEGGAQDLPRAYAYLALAAHGGDVNAAGLLNHYADRFSAADVESAEAIAMAWLAEHGVPE
ncbi:MAG: hypothetical protein GC206_11360 [Alphaproteobacteria bacterium]|nr:hypothetical protein [Alphaproteobacteria bacterium]